MQNASETGYSFNDELTVGEENDSHKQHSLALLLYRIPVQIDLILNNNIWRILN